MSRIASISSNATLCSKISFPIPDVYLNYKILLLVLRMRENCVRNRVAFEDLLSCPKICNNELRSFEFHISQNWVVLFFFRCEQGYTGRQTSHLFAPGRFWSVDPWLWIWMGLKINDLKIERSKKLNQIMSSLCLYNWMFLLTRSWSWKS